MTTYSDRGLADVGQAYRDALASLKRQRQRLQAEADRITAQLADLGRIEAALRLASETVAAARATVERAHTKRTPAP